MAADVGGELGGGGVAPLGVVAERLENDHVEVAAEAAAEALGRRGAEGAGLVPEREPRLWRQAPARRRGTGHGLAWPCEVGRARAAARQELVEQDAQTVHVGRRRYRPARGLLRRRVRWREHGAAGARRPVVLGAEELRDPEVQQFDARGVGRGRRGTGPLHVRAVLASGARGRVADATGRRAAVPLARGHEHVARLEVAVDDEAGVGVRHRLADFQEQSKALVDGEPLAIGVGRDRLAADELGGEVGAAVRGGPGVEEAGDGGVVQAREDAALGAEAPVEVFAEAGADELDRTALPEAVRKGARGAPDLAHAAGAEALVERPRPGLGRGQCLPDGVARVEREEALDLFAEGGIARGLAVQERGAGLWREVHGTVEEGGDGAPAVGAHGLGEGLPVRHGSVLGAVRRRGARGAPRPARRGATRGRGASRARPSPRSRRGRRRPRAT